MADSKELSEAIALLLAQQQESQLAQEKVQQLQEQKKQTRNKISELVKAGATTGDEVRDFLLEKGYGIDTKEEKRLKSLNNLLAGKTGELVAVAYIESFMIRSDREGEPRERVVFGVLNDDRLHFVENQSSYLAKCAAIPTHHYTIQDYRGDFSVQKGFIHEISPHSTFELIESGKQRIRYSMQNFHGYVLAGTDVVRDFITNTYKFGLSSHEMWGFKEPADLEKLFLQLGFFELAAE